MWQVQDQAGAARGQQGLAAGHHAERQTARGSAEEERDDLARAWGAREPAVPSNLAKGQYTEKSREDRVDEGRHAGADKNAGTTAAPCAQPQTEEPIERGRSQWRRRVMGNRRAFVVHDRCPVA